MQQALEGEHFELTNEQAEERLILMEKKKETQRGGDVNLGALKDRFDPQRLSTAKLFSPVLDYHQIMKEQKRFKEEEAKKMEKGQIYKYTFLNSR